MNNYVIDICFYPSDKNSNYTKNDILEDQRFLESFLIKKFDLVLEKFEIIVDVFDIEEWDGIPDEDHQCFCRFYVNNKLSIEDFININKKTLQLFSSNPWEDKRTNSFGDFSSINIDIAEYDSEYINELKKSWTLRDLHNLRSEIYVYSFFEGLSDF